MAIGLTPKYVAQYPLAGLRPEQFLVMALDTAAGLGWYMHYVSDTGLVASVVRWKAEVTIRIEGDSVSITSTSVDNLMIDWGRNRKNVKQFLAALGESRQTATAEYLQLRYEELWPWLPAPEADRLLAMRGRQSIQRSDILSLFRPTKDYFVTPIIFNINLFIFLLMALSGLSIFEPTSRQLIEWGANSPAWTLQEGEWWRLLSSVFLHIGILHLFMNMYALLLIGSQLEPRLGKLRFLSAYLLTGITASLTSLLWHQHGVSAGASGAIFGMYGVFLAMLTTSVVEKRNRKQLFASILFFVVYNLLGGLQPGIDNAAHVGGLVAGLAIGYSYVPYLRRKLAPPEQVANAATAAPEANEYY